MYINPFGVEYPNMLDKLKGKKTYLIAGVMLLWAAIGWWQGWVVPEQAQEVALEALAIVGLRAGIAKK